jgi:primosomal replication protein N
MKDLNNITCSGTVSKTYKSGFGLDISREYESNGATKISTTKVFVKGNDELLASVKEGTKVVVSGSLSSQQKEDKSISLCIYAFQVCSLAGTGKAKAPAVADDPGNDDIPF